MLHLKQTLHKTYTKSLKIISSLKIDLKSLGVVPQNLALVENLGRLLLSLMWLVSISLLVIVNFISSLLSLLKVTSMKLRKLWTLTEVPGWNVQYILCRWADVVKNMLSTLKTLPKRVWQKDGDLHPDSISAYSEMPGGPNTMSEYKNAQHEQAMKAPIKKPLDEQLREKGLL